MSFTKTNLNEFVKFIKEQDDVDDILCECKNESERGFVYERLWDIMIKCGYCNLFKKSKYDHMVGNANNGKVKLLLNYNKYFDKEKVYSGNLGGCSDITLKKKNNDKYIFISSKYPTNDDKKSVDYYDIQNIIAMAETNKHIYKTYKIYLLVPNKSKVLKKVLKANSSSDYITEHMTNDNILDTEDLEKCFKLFKEDIEQIEGEINYNKLYGNEKDKLILRFHQELITQKTTELIEEGNKSFGWFCKCRSGKTYMIGGLILKQLKIQKQLNVLIITPAPTETAPQFTDDLLNKFEDFEHFKIHDIKNSNELKNIETEDNNIFVLSKQLLQRYTNEKTIKSLKNLKIDIIAFDENHYSGTTDLSKEILRSYSSKNTVKVYLTATYSKPLNEWNIGKECQMYWDIEDEQICKSILINNNNVKKLQDKHGVEYITKTINYYSKLGLSINDMFDSYKNMPDLHLITNMFDSQRYEMLKQKLNSENKMGFCFEVLFGLNKQKTSLQYPTEVKRMLRYISGAYKEEDGEKTIFTRINNICSTNKTRKPFTQIWFLPPNNINEISKCVKTLMKEDPVLKKYDILCINRKNTDLAKDIKDEITKRETVALSKGKEGLILLAGNMLTLGITLNKCDLVVLLNNALSSDKVIQQMYKCMTEGENKKFGFVVDLNISRVLNTCINYTVYKNAKNINEKMKYLIENHLINIDVDMMFNKKLDSDAIVKKLMIIWKEDPINSFKNLLKNLDNDYVEFDTSTQTSINKLFTKSLKNGKVSVELKMKDENDEVQDLPNGKELIKNNSDDDNNSDDENNSDNEEEVKLDHISFTKDVLPFIIPLTCILTSKTKNMDFVKMLNDIKENPELLNTFDEQCLIWWNKKDLIDLIRTIVDKYFDKSSNTYNISVQFKMSLQSLIDNPKKLLELINDCLKPKDVEKKQFGEVFTPMKFINDNMLKDLEEYYLKKYGKNIYEERCLKWGDTSAGMGNFPIAIYYKLMDGLVKHFPNVQERQRHIIENMLYMAELNKKNCFILKQIFNMTNEFKLNLYEGDALKLDMTKTFGFKKFDVLIGNPPYNEALTKVGAKPLYNKFIEYYIDKCNILSYVIPSRWFAGGKGLDTFRKNMMNRTDIVYINHIDNACNIFGNLVDIKGGVNYFLIDKKHNDTCNYNGNNIKLNKFDIILDSKYYNIVDKLLNLKKITDIYLGRYFGFESNDKKLTDNNKKVKCYVSIQKGFIKYMDNKYISKKYDFYKVITARASHKALSGFGNIFIGEKNEIYTGSYIGFKIDDIEEAKSLLSYMKCRLPNFMLSLRKISQDISESTCKWIPLPPLDREWTDEKIYEYFKLSVEDIKLIKETNIIGYKNNKSSDLNNTLEKKNENNDLGHMSVKELREECKAKNISGYSNKKKDDLKNMLNKHKTIKDV